MKAEGFSLIEVTASTAIIAIISVISFVGYRNMGRVNFLEDEANTLVAGAEDARSTALSAIEMRKEGEQVEYFTVTFNEDHYVLFEDTEDSERRYFFEGGVEVVDGANRVVGFKPPEPEVVFLDSDLETEIFEDRKCIEFSLNYAQDPEDEDIIIRINRVGLIQLDNERICY